MTELTELQKYTHEEAWASLNLAQILLNQKRWARGQEVLRTALQLFHSLPRGFTDLEFEQQYTQVYIKLYRGF